ncbi:MAG TPA: beta-ketoacyl synthase N-terminal-like domain-containing protein [Opitutaceae bacterium]|nr:beta-ketoacyl synthase N-terminal-like domain-containing protein [Opitutaceae bacterium]
MRRRRVKITGIGPVTPAGIGREEFWKGILEPVSRVRPFAKLGEEYGPLVAAYMDKFDVGQYLDRKLLPKGAARHTLFAVAGSVLALQDAGVSKEEFAAANSAIITGTSLMDFGGTISTIDSVARRGVRGAQGRAVYTANLASVPTALNEAFDMASRSMVIQSSCCSGLDAIGYAANLIATGEADMVLCGGTEAPLHRCPLLELRATGLTPMTDEMPERLARPFDLWRTTGVVSEGASMFLIEAEKSPRQGYSYITGYAFANDKPGDLCGGIATAGKQALADARLRPDQVEAINAWGPGHKLIDQTEVQAMIDLFHSDLAGIPAVSIKGSVGSPLGAAPAIQVAAAALGHRCNAIPPTVNWEYPDPSCPLNLSNQARSVAHAVTLVNAHGLAGVNSSLILEKC